MHILVTGAAGFIGFHVASRLLNKGHAVIGIDNMNDYYDVRIKNSRLQILKSNNKFTSINCNIEDFDKLAKELNGFQVSGIIHLAAQAGVRYSIENPFAYANSNLLGFTSILEFARNFKVNHLVYASTSSVYGLNENLPFSEKNIADHPIQFYAATKRANELMAHSYSSLFKIPSTGLRFFTVYGPWGRPDMALFKFTKNILANKEIQVFNNGKHIRDFTYIDDIVDGILRAFNSPPNADQNWQPRHPSPDSSSAPFKIYNIGNSNPINLMEYINLIEEYLQKKAKIKYLPLQQGDVVRTQSDLSSINSSLGYSPKINVKVGVRNFIEWYLDYYKER
ncbi:NAD-dependent epimerase [Gammaproteobacteria bacterium]|nr:NAD-dependent epimerase [Gammaproteobacteria bacterium]MDA8798622.1 NAD-dependent epimerase [Gammaproteobacteria bacterium]MDC0919312.1 NAD-dependent epimerase [Gammaproteobacteria bacterium]